MGWTYDVRTPHVASPDWWVKWVGAFYVLSITDEEARMFVVVYHLGGWYATGMLAERMREEAGAP